MQRVDSKDAPAALYRDIAAAIRRSQPDGEVVLLASPNSSTAIGYYGRFKTLGTLYWENAAGLKAAARILSSRDANQAAVLSRQHRVTRIAMISEANFIDEYYRLLHPGASTEEIQECFGHRLLVGRRLPVWVRPIRHTIPDDLKVLEISVALFSIAFDRTVAEAEYEIDELIRESPLCSEHWLRKAELFFARNEWAGAAETMINGINRAKASERPVLFADAGGRFYRQGRAAEAISVYRAALEDAFEPHIAAYLAFLLSTTNEDTLRNGAEALFSGDHGASSARGARKISDPDRNKSCVGVGISLSRAPAYPAGAKTS